MYTLLINDDNTLQASIRKRILQGTSNVDYLHILTKPFYGDIDMNKLTPVLTYILPESKTRNTITLTPSEELYKERIEYKLCFDETLTSEVGDIKCWMSFIDNDTVVRKTTMGIITILPVEKSENEEDIPTTTSIDNIYLDKETNELYLTSNGMAVGDKISLDDLGDTIIENTDEGLVKVITE